MIEFNTILVLGPHTDDGEFGCGGTMAKFIEAGKNVYYATFSCAEESVPEGLPKDILLKEVKASSKVLGIKDIVLYVRIAAPTIKGKANRELIKFLSDILGISKSNLTIEKGRASRKKTIAIKGLSQNQVTRQLENH